MIGGKAQGQTRPTALGTQLNASVYGATIPTIYGCPRIPPLVIWAANLREGGSSKKGKKKGVTAYVENIDFLLGSNPIENVLQIWSNNTNKYLLDFKRAGPLTSPGGVQITWTDTDFYHVIAVTAEVQQSVTFNDYGSPEPTVYTDVLMEYPLWNAWHHGPNLIEAAQARFWPWIYAWKVGDGTVVQLPAVISFSGTLPNGTGNYFVYYAAIDPETQGDTPLAFNRFTFESQLGNGPEYGGALAAQQIIYPHYAGIGSSDMDLGSVGMIPDWRLETLGSYPMYPRGDADYADMIEDVIRSGMIQTGEALGLVHRGVNCNELPGAIQKNFAWQLEPSNGVLTYRQPNGAGNILIAFMRWRSGTGSGPTISDDAGNVWTNILPGLSTVGLWWANANVWPAGNVVSMIFHADFFAFDSQPMIIEVDPGYQTIDVIATATNTGTLASCSITTTGPAYIVVALNNDGETIDWPNAPPHWNLMFPAPGSPPNWSAMYYRVVTVAGTYEFQIPVGNSGPWTIGMIALKAAEPVAYPKALGNIIDADTMDLARVSARANGLYGSLALDSQKNASDWLTEFYLCMNAAPVWSGFRLKSIPYSEVSTIGNGAVYTSPTASGPIVNLTERDFIASGDSSPVVVERKAQVDTPNILQIEHMNRLADYAITITSQPEQGSIAKYGPRKADPQILHSLHDVAIARKILRVMVNRIAFLRNTYKFTVPARFSYLEAMDLITLTEPKIGLSLFPVRLTSVTENDNMELECEAEPFFYGVNSPVDLPVTTALPYNPNSAGLVALINAPVFAEVPLAMCLSNTPELWPVVSNSDPNYGGCLVSVSTDGGVSYSPPIGKIIGNAITGVLTADWPAALDPDTVNDLLLDLTESLGALPTITVADENNFVFPSYVAGPTPCGYELMAYSTATMTGTYLYTLPASPNGLRRAIFRQPMSGAIDHPLGTRFAYLDAVQLSTVPGILKALLQSTWIGQTLYFKFQAFNIFGGGLQALADVVAYPYTPCGKATPTTDGVVQIPVTSPAPGPFTVPHGLAAAPAFVTLQATNAGAIWLTGFDGTNIYLGASAAGVTAIASLWLAPADAEIALAPGAGGNFSVPHGLAGTPALIIVQMTSGGDIWKQSVSADGTNINLTASGGGITGKAEVWLTAPRPTGLPRFVSVPLTPSGGGNFTVAHGLAAVPVLIILRASSGFALWLQSPAADATNLFLSASGAGTGEAEVWA